MRLGKVHGAGPGALDHLRQIRSLLLVSAMDQDRRDGALRQAGIHHQGHIGRHHILANRRMHTIRQPLAAEFGGNGKPHPTARAILLERLFEARGRGHGSIIVANAALHVANPVEGLHDVFGELGAFVEDRFQHIRRRVRKARQIAEALVTEHFIEDEQRIANGGFVCRHATSSNCTISLMRPMRQGS